MQKLASPSNCSRNAPLTPCLLSVVEDTSRSNRGHAPCAAFKSKIGGACARLAPRGGFAADLTFTADPKLNCERREGWWRSDVGATGEVGRLAINRSGCNVSVSSSLIVENPPQPEIFYSSSFCKESCECGVSRTNWSNVKSPTMEWHLMDNLRRDARGRVYLTMLSLI